MTNEPLAEADRLRPYLPRILISWLHEQPGTTLRQIDGTVVFVDISGFTKMSERLARKGKVGAEEVTDVLGAVFARMLSVAYGNGGGLIKFGGDALLLLFTGEDHSSKGARAAVGMRRTLREIGTIQSSAGQITLRMSVGVHSGTFLFFLAGDSHRELMITGPAASEVVDMEGTAVAGEILVSRATAAALPPAILGAEKGHGVLLRREPPGLPLDVADADLSVAEIDLSRCIPVAIREQLLSGEVDPEHRQVTVAFVHFDGIDDLVRAHGPELVAFGLDELVSVVQAAADARGVTFLGTDIDHDGGKIILTAGAPTALGDDEDRMLLALREILDAGVSIPIRIGVNRGPVFAGDIGPAYRRTYTVMGDAVNLAARVMAKAQPGQLLATSSVLDAASVGFKTVALEPFMVKGKRDPVRAFEVGDLEGAKTIAERDDLPLVGRERELALFLDRVKQVREGRGSLVELVGNPGIGKTRLVRELLKLASDVPHLTVNCELFGASTPYLAFRNVVRSLLRSKETGEEAAGARLIEVVESLAPELKPWVPLLAMVADVEVPSTPQVDSLGEAFRRSKLEEVTEALLGRLATDPIVVVVEDVHWMDEPSAGLMRRIAERVSEHPWLICVTRRDVETSFAAPEGEPDCLSVRPQPLSDADAESLLEVATAATPLRPDEVSVLAARAGGNPLFLQEIALAAIGGQGIEELPGSVEAMVTAQIDRLPRRDRHVLRFASVLGMSFSQDFLENIVEDDRRPDEGSWRRLDEFLEPDGSGRWRFRHALMRDAAYEGLPYRTRRELHARSGEAILSGTEDPQDAAELLSLHFFSAQRYEESWIYSRQAGASAQAKFANTEAATFYRRAVESGARLGVPASVLAQVHDSLGDVKLLLGAYDQADAAFVAARRLLADDPPGQAAMWHKEARISYRLGRFSQSVRRIRRGLAAIEGAQDVESTRRRAELIALYTGIRAAQAKYVESIEWCRWLIANAPNMGDSREVLDALARAYYHLDFCYVEQGKIAEATHWRSALAIYEDLGQLDPQADVLIAAGAYAYYRGDWDEAIGHWERAKSLRDQVGNAVEAAWATNNIGEIRSDQGRLEEAERSFREAGRVLQAANQAEGLGFMFSNLGRVDARSGRFAEAAASFERARAIFDSAGSRAQVLETEARMAECALFQGDRERALAVADGAIERALAVEGVAIQGPMLHRIRGCALLGSGRIGEARDALQESLRAGRSRDASYEIALTLDALLMLELAEDIEPDPAKAGERDEIYRRLGVISPPRVL